MAKHNGPKGGLTVNDLIKAGDRSEKLAAGYGGTGPVGATGVWEEKEEVEEMQWPDEIEADDLELVKKEWWLVGYWVKEMHPGWFNVYKEPEDPRHKPRVVAGYGKPWNSKKWKREFPHQDQLETPQTDG